MIPAGTGGLAAAGGALAAALACAWLVRRVRRRLVVVTVEGSSMAPTLGDGDVVLVRRRGLGRLSVGDLVVVESPVPPVARPDWTWPDADEPPERRGWMVKRLAALPGQPWPAACADRHGRLPDGMIAVLGDNAAASVDSRQMGAVPGDRVLGVVVRRMATGRRPVTSPQLQEFSAR
ncbi:S26 family signal peptidase [Streptomyces tritici]|uniref:S26 family signal peptidase n=1 Tax=Streptomyces tritici TaxID=2054410 RepID=UPI003AEF83C7